MSGKILEIVEIIGRLRGDISDIRVVERAGKQKIQELEDEIDKNSRALMMEVIQVMPEALKIDWNKLEKRLGIDCYGNKVRWSKEERARPVKSRRSQGDGLRSCNLDL